jgi:carbon-monoxide dehydrogenase large subunit
VLTGRDLLDDGVKPIPHKAFSYHPAEIPLRNKDDAPIFAARHYPLPADRARFVGEAVAMVVAETVAIAKDAAERVEIDYEPLDAVIDAVAAAEPDAPQLWDGAENVLIDAQVGDAAATAAAFAEAAHVVKLKTWIPRVTGVPMEPRAAVGAFDPATARYTVHAGSGGAVRLKADISTTSIFRPSRSAS